MNINEKAFIVSLIQEYIKIHKNIDLLNEQLDLLENRLSIKDRGKLNTLEKNILLEIERLEIFRKVEMDFWSEIEKKYGPGVFDPNKLEYKLKKDGNAINI